MRSYFISFLNIQIQDILKGQEHYTRLKFTFLQLKDNNICMYVNKIPFIFLMIPVSGISTVCSLNTNNPHSEINCIVINETKNDHSLSSVHELIC